MSRNVAAPAPLPQGSVRSGGGIAASSAAVNSSGAVWENRFPTFVGGSPSAVVSRPSVSAVGSRTAAASGPAMTHPLRPVAAAKAQKQPQRSATPNEALTAAKQREQVHLQFTSSSIVPGSAASPTRGGGTAATTSPHRSRYQQQVPALDVSAGGGHVRNGGNAHASMAVVPSTTVADLSITSNGTNNTSHATDQGGYDRLTHSMERLQARLLHLPLHQRWETMSVWLDRYVFDAAAAKLATDAVTLHREVSKQTADRTEVNGLRTAVSFMLLEQLIHIMGHTYPKLLPLAESVRDDILRSVYVSPETDIDLRGSFFILDDPTDPNQQRQLIDRFYKKTYYQYLREMAAKLNKNTLVFEDTERTKDKQMRILNRIVAYWQNYTTGIMFMAWRGYIRGRREKRKMKADLKRAKDQVASASESVGRVASEKEVALERALELNDATQREMQALQSRCDGLESRNQELEDAGREMNKRFEEDARVRKLLSEIESLRKANAQLRASKADPAAPPMDASDGSVPAVAGDTSFVIIDGSDMAEVRGLREELAAAKARIAELEGGP